MGYTNEKKTITVDKVVTVSATCDCCGKVTDVKEVWGGWKYFTSCEGHYGQDSIESSYEEYLVCSWACYIKKVGLIFDKYKDDEDYQAAGVIDGIEWDFLKAVGTTPQ